MKKILSLILTLFCVLSLVGCGRSMDDIIKNESSITGFLIRKGVIGIKRLFLKMQLLDNSRFPCIEPLFNRPGNKIRKESGLIRILDSNLTPCPLTCS